MVLYGDEVGRSQGGNNNTYCQDNDLTWMNWNFDAQQSHLLRFFRNLIRFRREHPVFRRDRFEPVSQASRVEMAWHGQRLFHPDWSYESRSLALHLTKNDGPETHDNIFVIANAYWEDLRFELPVSNHLQWARFLDTSFESPHDICEPGHERPLSDLHSYTAAARTVVALVGQTGEGITLPWDSHEAG